MRVASCAGLHHCAARPLFFFSPHRSTLKVTGTGIRATVCQSGCVFVTLREVVWFLVSAFQRPSHTGAAGECSREKTCTVVQTELAEPTPTEWRCVLLLTVPHRYGEDVPNWQAPLIVLIPPSCQNMWDRILFSANPGDADFFLSNQCARSRNGNITVRLSVSFMIAAHILRKEWGTQVRCYLRRARVHSFVSAEPTDIKTIPRCVLLDVLRLLGVQLNHQDFWALRDGDRLLEPFHSSGHCRALRGFGESYGLRDGYSFTTEFDGGNPMTAFVSGYMIYRLERLRAQDPTATCGEDGRNGPWRVWCGVATI